MPSKPISCLKLFHIDTATWGYINIWPTPFGKAPWKRRKELTEDCTRVFIKTIKRKPTQTRGQIQIQMRITFTDTQIRMRMLIRRYGSEGRLIMISPNWQRSKQPWEVIIEGWLPRPCVHFSGGLTPVQCPPSTVQWPVATVPAYLCVTQRNYTTFLARAFRQWLFAHWFYERAALLRPSSGFRTSEHQSIRTSRQPSLRPASSATPKNYPTITERTAE